jgi:hypothetical protein
MDSPCVPCLVKAMCQKSCLELLDYVRQMLSAHDIFDISGDFYSDVCQTMRSRKDKFRVNYNIRKTNRSCSIIPTDIHYYNGVILHIVPHIDRQEGIYEQPG